MSTFHDIVGPLYPVLDWPMNTGPNGGYNFFSGIGGGCFFVGGAGAWWHHHACSQPRCVRLGHPHPKHGRPVCRRHFHHDVAPPDPDSESFKTGG